MADKTKKVPENVSGPYYVDTECTACGLCTDDAPENFEMAESGDNAYVKKQPAGDDEKTSCESARESCPADAIGSDG
ncbi:MAG: ferredoxin [Spirochaetales bacterium]|nr:MAG: ferredoxin [Spirochaetales bacterium]